MEVRASIFCARLRVRGRQSMDSTVAFLAASCSISAGFCAGQTKPIKAPPSRISATSSLLGGRTLNTISAAAHKAAAPSMTSAPAAR